jgi:hypothetical protein
MLRTGDFEINGLAGDEGKFAICDGGNDGAGDGCKRCGKASLHEKPAND